MQQASPQRYSVDRHGSASRDGNNRSMSRDQEFTDTQFKSKLLSSKVAAKEVEKEALTLKNRIALLEKEEQKVLKKIESAKRQALDILSQKSRNQKVNEEKEKLYTEKSKEIEVKKVLVTTKKDEQKEKVKEAVIEKILTTKDKASEIRENMRVGL